MLAQHARIIELGQVSMLMQLRKIESKKLQVTDFNFCHVIFAHSSKWHPWLEPYLLSPSDATVRRTQIIVSGCIPKK